MNLKNKENQLYIHYIKERDDYSFKELFKLVDSWLFKMIFRMVGDRKATEDIIQQTWLSVIEKNTNFNPEKGLITNYIHSIAKNFALKWLKQQSKVLTGKITDTAVNSAIEEDIDNESLKSIIHKSLKQLSNQNHLDAILLYYFAELRINEIKDVLGTTEQNVKSWLHRGRLDLEKELKKYISSEAIQEIISGISSNSENR